MDDITEKTPQGIVRSVAREFGYDLNNDQINNILWEQTGYPGFWKTDDPLTEIREQVREFFEGDIYGWAPCERCGKLANKDKSLCEPCEREMFLRLKREAVTLKNTEEE